MPLNSFDFFYGKNRCPSCGSNIDWGITTNYEIESDSEVCSICKATLGCKEEFKNF